MKKNFEIRKRNTRRHVLGMVCLILSTVLLCETVQATDYYDGAASSHLTTGSTGDIAVTNPSEFGHYENVTTTTSSWGQVGVTGGDTPITNHPITKLVSRTTPGHANNNSYVASYGSSHAGWQIQLANGEWQSYDSCNSPLKSSIPGLTEGALKFHVGADGVVYFTCSTDGCTTARIIDMECYGFYYNSGVPYLTGFTGWLYCPQCQPLSKLDMYNQPGEAWRQITSGIFSGSVPEAGNPTSLQPIYGEVTTTTTTVNFVEGHSYRGVYVWPEIRTTYNGSFTYTIDPGYSDDSIRSVKSADGYISTFLNKSYNASGVGPSVDSSGNANYIKHSTSASSGYKYQITGSAVIDYRGTHPTRYDTDTPHRGAVYGVRINQPVNNGVNVGFGSHAYYSVHDYINFQEWVFNYMPGRCIHNFEGDDNYCISLYKGKNLGKSGYGYVNIPRCNTGVYEPGMLGICADCGETIPSLFYSTPETISSVRRIRNGANYISFCPYHMYNMNLDGSTFYYLGGHIEQHVSLVHYCYEDSINQYVLQLEPNDPNPAYLGLTAYTTSGYFYNVFEDGKQVAYVTENGKLEPKWDGNGNLVENVPRLTAKNTIAPGIWNSRGYIFDHWQLWTGSDWVDLDDTPTWKEVVDILGSTNSMLEKDRSKIRLQATWIIPTRDVQVIDGDSLAVTNDPRTATKIGNPYKDILFQEYQVIANAPNKSGTIQFVPGREGVTVGNIPTVSQFVSHSSWAGNTNYRKNEGIFDSSTNTYFNLKSTSDMDYIVANYAWQTVTLPSPTSQGAVFMGWYTQPDGKGTFCGAGGAPYTPRSASETLYGYWSVDDMTIYATVTDHKAGTSHVWWDYNNVNIAGEVFYKIYRNKKVVSNDDSMGSEISSTSLTIPDRTESYTVQVAGVYNVVLKGAAGGSVTGASGGNGATYTLTMLLRKGDVLSVNTNAGGAYTGGTGKNFDKADSGTYSANGGNATVLYLNGTKIAVAGGGGGALRLPNGTAIAGGNARQTGTSSTKETSSNPYGSTYVSTSTDYFAVATAGGGGGENSGAYGSGIVKRHAHVNACKHKHSAGGGTLLSGTALTADAVYSESGGCYTKKHAHIHQGNSTDGGDCYEWVEPYCGGCYWDDAEGKWKQGWCPNCGRDEPTWCECAGGYYRLNCNNADTYSLSCTLGEGIVCGKDDSWGYYALTGTSKTLTTASTGGTCWYDTSKVMSASFAATNIGSGSFSLTSVVLGITNLDNMDDTHTDDKAAPTTPAKNVNNGNKVRPGEIAYEKVNTTADGSTFDIYMEYASWMPSADNGTTYRFHGETWDIKANSTSTSGFSSMRCDTTCDDASCSICAPKRSDYNNPVGCKDASVTVTAGLKHYNWKVTNSAGTVVASGETTDTRLGRVKIASGTSSAALKDTFTLYVEAEDAATWGTDSTQGNKSAPRTWTLKVDIPGPGDDVVPDPDIHLVGILKEPTLSVSTGTGIYKNGTTYYVKADGTTRVKLTADAKLNPVYQSRITTLNLGTNYYNGYIVSTPLWTRTKAATNTGGDIGDFMTNGTTSISVLTDSETKVSQEFVTMGETPITIKPYAVAECLGLNDEGCMEKSHTLKNSGNAVTLVGDKSAPTVTINGRSFIGDNCSTEFDWASSQSIIGSVVDNGSGVANVTIEYLDDVVMNYHTDSGRHTSCSINETITREGENVYIVTAEDNVGNKTIIQMTVRVDCSKPTITDGTFGLDYENGSDVKNHTNPSTGTTGTWPSTDVDAYWEYDWYSTNRTLAYIAEDDVSGIDHIELFKANESWVKGASLVRKTANENGTASLCYIVETEGTTRYIVEAYDVKGNKTTVFILARVDKSTPSCMAVTHTSIDMEGFTIDQANAAVSGGLDLRLKWDCTWSDFGLTGNKTDAKDSSGLQSATLYLYEPDALTEDASGNLVPIVKAYPMTLVSNNERTLQGTSLFEPVDRWLTQKYTVTVNTFVDFPHSAVLGWRIVATDNVGNSYSKEGYDTIRNFLIKAVAHATKSGAYNLPSDDGKTSTAFFKTGELGYVEVWTIGYVEELELDFSDGGIGQEANREIARGALSSKYLLGVHGVTGEETRFVTTLPEHKVENGIPDRDDGVPFATHFLYGNDEVNYSIGTDSTAGWISDGTMMRIPPSHVLVKSGEKDKWGNDICKWEYRTAKVYGHKNNLCGSPATAPYVIWDETGDDVHYRLIHGTVGNW